MNQAHSDTSEIRDVQIGQCINETMVAEMIWHTMTLVIFKSH